MCDQIKACTTRELNDFMATLRGMSEHVGNLYPTGALSVMRNLLAPEGTHPLSAVQMIGKTWEPGRSIGIGFLDGSLAQRTKVQRWAETWLQHANLSFKFDPADPEIRVSFNPRGGSWSNVGTDALSIRSGPTINFGWVTDSSDDVSDRAVILHEFGHMLGLGHEQSSPGQDIRWNKEYALRWYMQSQGWSAQMVVDNVFTVFDRRDVIATAYDRTSIMQYPVPAELTLDGRGIDWNTILSPLDIQHIGIMYPGSRVMPPSPIKKPAPTPVPSGLPEIVLGGTASKLPIPSPGKPARFALTVPASQVLDLGVVVEHGRGREPIVAVIPENEPPLSLGLVNGRGLFSFDAGRYEVQVYNPFPTLTGTAWVKVSTR